MLTDTVDTSNGLQLNSRVDEWLTEKDMGCVDKVEAR